MEFSNDVQLPSVSAFNEAKPACVLCNLDPSRKEKFDVDAFRKSIRTDKPSLKYKLKTLKQSVCGVCFVTYRIEEKIRAYEAEEVEREERRRIREEEYRKFLERSRRQREIDPEKIPVLEILALDASRRAESQFRSVTDDLIDAVPLEVQAKIIARFLETAHNQGQLAPHIKDQCEYRVQAKIIVVDDVTGEEIYSEVHTVSRIPFIGESFWIHGENYRACNVSHQDPMWGACAVVRCISL